jgi:hypothetical protein
VCPFVIDGRYNFNPSGLLAQFLGLAPFGFLRVLGPLGNLHPLRLTRLFFGSAGEHSEEQMARFFHRYGPFVTVGKPGEMIPQTGPFVSSSEIQSAGNCGRIAFSRRDGRSAAIRFRRDTVGSGTRAEHDGLGESAYLPSSDSCY